MCMGCGDITPDQLANLFKIISLAREHASDCTGFHDTKARLMELVFVDENYRLIERNE